MRRKEGVLYSEECPTANQGRCVAAMSPYRIFL